MKKLFTLLLCIAVSSLALAQGRGIALLDKAQGQRVMFNYVYSLDQGKGMNEVTAGSVIAEAECFYVTGLGLKSYSDGVTLWMVDESEREVVIDSVLKDDPMTNPALLVSSYREFMDKITVNSEGTDSLDLTIKLDDNATVRFVLTNVRYSEPKGRDGFVFDTSALSTKWVVTDLR